MNSKLDPLVLRDLFAGCTAADNEAFVPLYDGVDMLRLYGPDPRDQLTRSEEPSAALLRYQPGAQVPRHRHRGYEHILVLSGSQSDERGSYGRGALVVNPPGSNHTVRSEEGCLVLIIWDHPVEVL